MHDVFMACSNESCAECEDSCKIDESIPCSPDCENLNVIGTPYSLECLECDALTEEDKDKWADQFREWGAVICPECNRGEVVRRDYIEYLSTFSLQRHSTSENPNYVKIGLPKSTEKMEGIESFGECKYCFATFKADDAGGVYLDKVINEGIKS